MTQINASDILDFWFSANTRAFWFKKSPTLDQTISLRFDALYQRAAQGLLEDWQTQVTGALALVIVLDQFPLHLYRGQGRSFATEKNARDVAGHAITCGFDQRMKAEEKSFLYMPFMHSEALTDQQRAIDLYTAAGLNDDLKYARHHYRIIEQFGRFPHRNAALGRISSEQERQYLNAPGAFHG